MRSTLLDASLYPLLHPGVEQPQASLSAPPTAALSRAVAGLAARLGVAVEPEWVSGAPLDPVLSAGLVLVVEALAFCHDATARLLEGFGVPLSATGGEQDVTPPVREVMAVRTCAERLQRRGLELQRFLATAPDAVGQDVDLWPVLRLDLDGGDDTVVHDYMLSVDRGGDDRYFNNAGANPIDVRRGPPGSAAPEAGPARGCINPLYDLEAGECVLSAALLVDAAGDDVYGRLEPPDEQADGICTTDPIVRRVMTAGAGFAGVGVLLEGGGSDRYLAKTVAEGAGHLGGVGILRDEAGDDSYVAIRMAHGFGVGSGIGILRDLGGDDVHGYYLPRPRDPAAAYKTPGSGGVLDSLGICDNVPRWDQGSGFSGGTGILVDDAGDDHYRAPPPLDHRPGGGLVLRTGSQGFGSAGFGVFVDRSGRDRYSAMPGRTDGATVLPRPGSTGLFHDTPAGGPLVVALGLRYVPERVVVDRGRSVQFFNPDPAGTAGSAGHTVTELRRDGPPRFDTGVVPLGGVAEVRGVASLPPGRYRFFCVIHPFMVGTLSIR